MDINAQGNTSSGRDLDLEWRLIRRTEPAAAAHISGEADLVARKLR